MNKGFIKLSALFISVLALVGIIGYLVSVKNTEAKKSEEPKKIDICHCASVNNCQTLNITEEALNGHFDAQGKPLHSGDHEGKCEKDVCKNIEGIQETIPKDYYADKDKCYAKVLVCTDREALNYGGKDGKFDEEKEVSDNELCEYVQVSPTQAPLPTTIPEQPKGTTPAGAPQCTDSTPLVLPSNVHVVRSGADATVNFFTSSNNANIYFKEVNALNWEHAARDIVVTGGYVSYTIHDLNPVLGYTFGVQAANSCAGGETVVAVVVDGPESVTFPLSYYEWIR